MTSPISRDAPGRSMVVVGGGVIGLACAWELSRGGIGATVVDPGDASAGATWAAGGMLAPLGEARAPGPFLRLGLASLARYPEFVARLEAVSGWPVPLHLNGKLLTASTPGGVTRLRERLHWIQREGHPVRWLDGAEARALEPALSPEVRAGLLLEGNGRVDNRAIMRALQSTVDRAGIRLVRGRVARLRTRGTRVDGVVLEDGRTLQAPRVLLAAGAWSGQVEGLPRSLPVRPVKGQMLALAPGGRPLRRVVTSPEAYLIPRDTSRGPVVVVGATSEEAGFDRSLDDRAQGVLEAGARTLVPGLCAAPVVERWSGLRPGTPDDGPVLGPDPELEGLWYATGHYRNGVLLAPETAHLIARGLQDRAVLPSAFRPDRFPEGSPQA